VIIHCTKGWRTDIRDCRHSHSYHTAVRSVRTHFRPFVFPSPPFRATVFHILFNRPVQLLRYSILSGSSSAKLFRIKTFRTIKPSLTGSFYSKKDEEPRTISSLARLCSASLGRTCAIQEEESTLRLPLPFTFKRGQALLTSLKLAILRVPLAQNSTHSSTLPQHPKAIVHQLHDSRSHPILQLRHKNRMQCRSHEASFYLCD
jgi:hypothetical protein